MLYQNLIFGGRISAADDDGVQFELPERRDCVESDESTESLNLRPLVSNGKRRMQITVTAITTSNMTKASFRWQLLINATATRGHTIPPILPTAVATPAPVDLTEVGYNQKQRVIENTKTNKLLSFDWMNAVINSKD